MYCEMKETIRIDLSFLAGSSSEDQHDSGFSFLVDEL